MSNDVVGGGFFKDACWAQVSSGSHLVGGIFYPLHSSLEGISVEEKGEKFRAKSQIQTEFSSTKYGSGKKLRTKRFHLMGFFTREVTLKSYSPSNADFENLLQLFEVSSYQLCGDNCFLITERRMVGSPCKVGKRSSGWAWNGIFNRFFTHLRDSWNSRSGNCQFLPI